MYSFDSSLEFTMESMVKTVYLDTLIVHKNYILELEQYRKNNNPVIMNFKYAVAPKQYKNSVLCGEIYRTNNCTSSFDNRERH